MKSAYPQTITPVKPGVIPYPVPESWKRAIGILKHKRLNPLVYQKKIRKEWEGRLKRQITRAERNGN